MTTRRIALYARVSTAEQARPDATSIEKQLSAGRLEAARLEQFGEVEIVKQYTEEGASGTVRLSERPQGARLLTDAGRGKFDTVIFYALDRFTRNAGKGLMDFALLEEDLGLTLIFAKENIDTKQPSGKLFRTILAAFAEFEVDTIRDRSMAGRYGKAQTSAAWPSGVVPYGYETDEFGELQWRTEEGIAVRFIFETRAAGATLLETAGRANAEGHRPRERKGTQALFTALSVSRLLRRPLYQGDGIQKHLRAAKGTEAEPFTYPAPAIVSRDLWAKAQGR